MAVLGAFIVFFATFVKITIKHCKCLSVSLMNLGNSFTVREDEPCCGYIYPMDI